MEVYEDETNVRYQVTPYAILSFPLSCVCSACSEVLLARLLVWSCISMLAFCSGCKYRPECSKNEYDSIR